MRSASANGRAPAGTTMNSWRSIELSRVRAAVDDVHHRHGQRRASVAAEVAVERERRPRRRPPSRPRARRRGSRSRRAAPCSASRRARSAARRAPRWSSASTPRTAARDLAAHVRDRARDALAAAGLAAVAQLDRLVRAGRRARRTAARPTAPDSSSTSTSTVGLPRESRIWRARTLRIAVMREPPWRGRSSAPARRAASSAQRSPSPAGELLGALDARAEPLRSSPRSASSGSTFEPARHVHDGEQHVADSSSRASGSVSGAGRRPRARRPARASSSSSSASGAADVRVLVADRLARRCTLRA